MVKRPGLRLEDLLMAVGLDASASAPESDPAEIADALHSAETGLKYTGYVARERANAARVEGLAGLTLPDGLDYSGILSISHEGREKLGDVRPTTLGQASRIPGVSPSDIHNLVVELVKRRRGVSRETSSNESA